MVIVKLSIYLVNHVLNVDIRSRTKVKDVDTYITKMK